MGWTPHSLAQGDRVIVVANPSKNPARRIVLGQRILEDDGTRLEIPQLNNQVRASSDQTHIAHSLSGVWVPRWNEDVASGFLAARKAWSLTPDGIAAIDGYGSAMNSGKDCVPEPIPYRMIWPLPVTIEVGDDVTTIEFETSEKRDVRMDRSSHDSAPYTYFGDSVGSWDGDTLVVDTAHFREHRRGNAPGGLASSRQKHLIERFRLSDDQTYLNYEFRLEDPRYLAEPITGTLELAYEPDFNFAKSPCDLEVARRYLQD